jgi:hypothetical protein
MTVAREDFRQLEVLIEEQFKSHPVMSTSSRQDQYVLADSHSGLPDRFQPARPGAVGCRGRNRCRKEPVGSLVGRFMSNKHH